MSDRDFNNAAKIRQGEKLQAERDEVSRQQLLDESEKARLRKPHAQAGMTAIEKRILARAEAHMKIRAAIEAGDYSGGLTSKPKATAQARWDAAIGKAVTECNGDRRRAVAMVARQNPKLREDLISEANAGR